MLREADTWSLPCDEGRTPAVRTLLARALFPTMR